jgi:hypothetical protein
MPFMDRLTREDNIKGVPKDILQKAVDSTHVVYNKINLWDV